MLFISIVPPENEKYLLEMSGETKHHTVPLLAGQQSSDNVII